MLSKKGELRMQIAQRKGFQWLRAHESMYVLAKPDWSNVNGSAWKKIDWPKKMPDVDDCVFSVFVPDWPNCEGIDELLKELREVEIYAWPDGARVAIRDYTSSTGKIIWEAASIPEAVCLAWLDWHDRLQGR